MDIVNHGDRLNHHTLSELYQFLKPDIEKKCNEFRSIWHRADENELFQELVFCLLTPQSNAHRAWRAVQEMARTDLLLTGNTQQLVTIVRAVRFHNNKTSYILHARQMIFGHIKERLSVFSRDSERRDWLVKSVMGLGMKEASHFLRNIGLYDECAILDRHILRRLSSLGVLSEFPKTMNAKKYCEIEHAMKKFAVSCEIPLAHLDMVLWFDANKELFK